MSNKDVNKISEEPQNGFTADLLSKQELKAAFAESKRKEEVRTLMHWGFKVLLICAIILIISVFIIRILHLIMPTCWDWLTIEQLQAIDKLLFSALLGGIIGKYFDKIIK